jgi:hypothetical protein
VVDQAFKSGLHLRGQLARVVDVNTHPERMKFLEHLAQRRRDPLREENRDPCADPDELDMFDGAQTAQNPPEFIVREEQGISAGE